MRPHPLCSGASYPPFLVRCPRISSEPLFSGILPLLIFGTLLPDRPSPTLTELLTHPVGKGHTPPCLSSLRRGRLFPPFPHSAVPPPFLTFREYPSVYYLSLSDGRLSDFPPSSFIESSFALRYPVKKDHVSLFTKRRSASSFFSGVPKLVSKLLFSQDLPPPFVR